MKRLEKILEQILEKLNSMETEQKEMKADIKLIKTQQSEHGKIIQEVRHAQKAQKAQIDQLVINTAHISGKQEELIQTVDRLDGDVSFLVRKAAEHEEDIRDLRRAK
jgi:chromosome segregation ATPase